MEKPSCLLSNEHSLWKKKRMLKASVDFQLKMTVKLTLDEQKSSLGQSE